MVFSIDILVGTFRERLPLLETAVPLNHAGISPQPYSDRIAKFEKDRAMLLPSDVLSAAADARRRVKELYAHMTRAGADEIAVTKNTAEGVNFIAQGYPWRKGDKILTISVEYPSNVYPWWNIRSRGVEVVTVPERDGRVEWDEFEQALDGGITLVAISHVEFASGFAFDLARVSEACQKRGIFLFVDVAQSLGALPVDLSLVDAAAWPTWKWLMGPLGVGGFYLARKHHDRILPVFVGTDGMVPGADYLDYRFEYKPGAERYEYSTENSLGILGTLESLERLEPLIRKGGLGVAPLAERIFEVGDLLVEIMRDRGYRIFSSLDEGERSGILSFVAPRDPREIVSRLTKSGYECSCRGGRLRLSPHFYNLPKDFDRLGDLLA